MEDLPPDTVEHESDAEEKEAAKDFEDAIKSCGFGLFNICLLLACIPGLVASTFEMLTISFVLPSAECDLHLNLMDKGTLNGMTYAGGILSSIPWGFTADTFGRKRILVFGLLLLGLITLCSSTSQNVHQLMMYKLLGGFINSGPTAVFYSYISEFHGKTHRLRIMITIGLIKAMPTFLEPLLAYIILPKHIDFEFLHLHYSAWKMFIAITSIPAFLSGILLIFFPESPKFLMSRGKNEQALKAFKTIYAMNTYKTKESYPITHLVDEYIRKSFQIRPEIDEPVCRSCQKRARLVTKFTDGFKQIRQLCSPRYFGLVLIIFATFFAVLFSVTPVRLWLPSYFATIKEMQFEGDNITDTCHILNYTINRATMINSLSNESLNNKTSVEHCKVHIEASSYINNMYTATALLINYIIMTIIVQYAGNNFLMRLNLAVACYSLISLYWSQSELGTLILACIFSATGIVAQTLILNISISSFPTTMRTMAVITLIAFGKFGGMLGNVVMPLLMKMHCSCMFALYGAFILFSLTFSYFIPNTTKQDLK